MSRLVHLRCHHPSQRTASSLRVVGIKATASRRARMTARMSIPWRDLDAADRTRTPKRVAAPEIVAEHGSPEIDLRMQRAAMREIVTVPQPSRSAVKAARSAPAKRVALTARIRATATIEKFAHHARLTTRLLVIPFEEAP